MTAGVEVATQVLWFGSRASLGRWFELTGERSTVLKGKEKKRKERHITSGKPAAYFSAMCEMVSVRIE